MMKAWNIYIYTRVKIMAGIDIAEKRKSKSVFNILLYKDYPGATRYSSKGQRWCFTADSKQGKILTAVLLIITGRFLW